MNIPFFDYPAVFSKYKDSFLEIFDKVSSKGSFIMQDELLNFEKKIAAYSKCNFAVGVGNATDALEMLVNVSGITKGDEVIISSHTMIATASAIATNGAKVVPVECGEDHLIDPEAVEKAITNKTKCISVMSVYSSNENGSYKFFYTKWRCSVRKQRGGNIIFWH